MERNKKDPEQNNKVEKVTRKLNENRMNKQEERENKARKGNDIDTWWLQMKGQGKVSTMQNETTTTTTTTTTTK